MKEDIFKIIDKVVESIKKPIPNNPALITF